MKKKTLFLCETVDRLAEVIADHVFNAYEVVNGKRTIVHYPIEFAVDDTPTKDEWDKMTAKDKKNAFDCATGTYGVVDVGELFDAECVRLACAYYGGSNVCTMKVTDEDTSYEQLVDGVSDMLDEALFCDARKDIIVQVTTEVIDS